MKRFFIAVLFVGLFVTASSIWAEGDSQKTKAPAKVENAEKKTTPVKRTSTACSSDIKAGGDAKLSITTDCCIDKKVEVSAKTVADCCTNKTAANETKKSSGKKTD